ncbi:ATP-grasp domain-containing protein [Solwaraspora sp. WMMD1047]|uniref:ATP-grasp domain-containing protein n=1 Tax=Solwaraspora sp. WMMD1047 TaxID=3016102 RepID=UPI002416F799|nr:ATP-grasp domain-containing protein [Solwaraspora sp. WMMD1047]MDG4829286.1 ATP-grasp domain-containing protein [Solwaraspora sp. WMMD1047]
MTVVVTKKQVLLLNSDRPEVLRVLRARTDVDLRVMTRPANADVYDGHRLALVDNFADLTQVQAAAYELAAYGPVDHVIAATEKSVIAAGLVRSLLGVPGPGFDQSLWSAHKRAMKDRLRAAGLPVTAYAQVATLDEVPRAALRTGWPVVVKPVLGTGSNYTYHIHTLDEFAERHRDGAFADLAGLRLPIQVEKAVRFTQEYHCDGVVQDGEVTLAAVSRYFIPPLQTSPYADAGCVVDQTEPFSLEVLDLHRRVAAALGIEAGVTHLEVFRTPSGPVVGEVAIRPGGMGIARMVLHALGVDLWEELVRVSLGEPAAPPVRQPHPQTIGRTRLPARDGLLERVSVVPGVIEVLDPEECASPGCLEVYLTVADEAAADAFIARLHRMAEWSGEDVDASADPARAECAQPLVSDRRSSR